MYRKTRNTVLATVMALVITQPVWADEDEHEEQAFLSLLSNYLTLSEEMASIAAKPEVTVYLAMEGIVEIHENRGEKAKAIPDLEKILDIY